MIRLTDETYVINSVNGNAINLRFIDLSEELSNLTLQNIGSTINRYFTKTIRWDREGTLTNAIFNTNEHVLLSFTDDLKYITFDDDHSIDIQFDAIGEHIYTYYNENVFILLNEGWYEYPNTEYYICGIKWTDPLVLGGDYYGWGLIVKDNAYTPSRISVDVVACCMYEIPLNERHPEIYEPTDPEGEESEPDNYSGAYFTPYDNIEVPELPPNSASFNIADHNYSIGKNFYKDSINTMLWHSDFIKDFVESADVPMNTIIKCFNLPYLPDIEGTEPFIMGNFRIATPECLIVSNEWKKLDFGTVEVGSYSSQFFDTNINVSIYLPYCGMISLDPEDVIPNGENDKIKIKVEYHAHFSSGDLYAYVSSNRGQYDKANGENYHVIATATGNCMNTIALSSSSGNWAIEGVKGALMGGVSGALSNPLALFGAVSGAVSGLSNSQNIDYRYKSGNPTVNLASIQYPYLIFDYPIQDLPNSEKGHQYRNLYGVPTNKAIKLSTLNGYTEIDEVHIDSGRMTDGEKNELLNILKGGIII